MHRLERRRKFHNAIVNLLFPPPSSPENEEDNDQTNKFGELSHVDVFRDLDSDPIENSCRSSSLESEGEEGGANKLSRAQRKRLRKKKLREAASSRPRKMIGPLLTSPSGDGLPEDFPQDVRRNVCEEPNTAAVAPFESSVIDGSNQLGACNTQNKLKQRRKAKRLARDRARTSAVGNSSQDDQSCDKGTCCAGQVSDEKC